MPDKKGDTMMSFVKEKNRITYVQNGEMLAEITFPALENDENTVNIDHTFVNDVLRGQGVAGTLMEQTVEVLRADGRKAIATCSYAKKWFEKHPEAKDVLR